MSTNYIFISATLSLSLILIPNAFCQAPNRDLETMEVSTPNQWSFYKYIEHPVNLFNGAQDINIELFTLKDGPISIPLTIRYNTSGIKIKEEASWVGLGWNLNIGGYRTEVPVGGSDASDELYDIYKNSFYNDTYPHPLTYAKYEITQEDYNALGFKDSYRIQLCGKTSPDVFFYAYPGGNGKYVIDPRDGKALLIRREEDIEIVGSKIITPEGIRHEYDKENEFISSDANGNVLYKSMPLKRSTYPNGDEVNYTYREKMYVDHQTSQYICGLFTPNLSGSFVQECLDKKLGRIENTVSKLESTLTEVNTPCYKIVFHLSDRLDHSIAQKLDSIVLWDKLNGERIKKYVFEYSYFKPREENEQTDKFNAYRLRLDSIKEQSASSTKSIGMYQFKYNKTPLPSKDSFSCDFWGYANSDSALTDLDESIPNLEPLYWWSSKEEHKQLIKESKKWGNVDKRHNEAYCGAGMLKEIIYPTGGSTTFDFESNSFYDKFIPSVGDTIVIGREETKHLWNTNNKNTDYPGQLFEFDSPKNFTISYKLKRGCASWLNLINCKINLQTGIMSETSQEEILYDFRSDCENAFYSSTPIDELSGELHIRIPQGMSAVSLFLPNDIGSDKEARLDVTIKYIDRNADEEVSVIRTCRGAGMRVKSVSNKDIDGTILQNTRYEYIDKTNGESSGRLYTRPQFDKEMTSYSVLGGIQRDSLGNNEIVPGIVTSMREYEIDAEQIGNNPYGMPEGVGYGIVRESIDGIGGYKEYNFNTLNLSPIEEDHAQFNYVADSPLIGKCESETYFDVNGNIVERHKYEYRLKISKNLKGIHLVSAYDWHNDILEMLDPYNYTLLPGAEKPYMDNCLWLYVFNLNQNEVYLTKEIIERDGVKQTIEYDYDECIMLPIVKRYSQSDGRFISHHFSYLNNKVRHIINPITEERLKKSGLTYFIRKNNYDNYGLLADVRFQNVQDGSSIVAWHKEKSDARGNALKVRLWEVEAKKYRWDLGGRRIIEKSELADSASGNWHTTKYTYDNKGLLDRIELPNGLVNGFNYDEFGRLRSEYRVYDGNMHLDKSYDYKLYTEIGSGGENYISKLEYLTSNDSREHRVYVNGLGLPCQEIEADGYCDEQARITIHKYDAALRESKTYLPYGLSNNYMQRRPNYLKEQQTFYGSNFAYMENEYESSPLGRRIGEIKAGDDIREAKVKKQTKYRGNKSAEVLQLTSTYAGIILVKGYYADSTLFCTHLIDEDENEQLEYKDLIGNTVLKRQVLKNSDNTVTNVDTYYVYDDYTNLRYVLPPDISAELNVNNSYGDASDIAKLSYYYEYDGYGREVKSHIPGCEEEVKSYDKRGMMVSSQGPREREEGVRREFVYDGLRRLSEEKVIGQSDTLLMHKLFYDTPMDEAIPFMQIDSQGTSEEKLLQNLTGLLSGEWVAINKDTYYFAKPQYVKRSYYYDNLNQLAQIAEQDYLRGVSRYSYSYDYRGNVTNEAEEHIMNSFSMRKITEKYYYRNGLLRAEGGYLPDNNIGLGLSYEYDCLENPVKQNYEYRGAYTAYYEQTNAYNLRCERLRIQNQFFEQYIDYGFGGKINEICYLHGGNEYSYQYSYDSLGRLLNANSPSLNIPTERHFEYDIAGRIKYLERCDVNKTDTLRYQYSKGKLQTFNNSHYFRYNAAGDMTYNGRTGCSIVYGLTGLPSNIETDDNIVYYDYLWTGEKIATIVYNTIGKINSGSFILNWEGANGHNFSLESVSMPGGRVIYTSENREVELFPMMYFIDNLGSIRSIVNAASGNELKHYDYYPYGLEWGYEHKDNSAEYRYKFNGKEDQGMFGVDYLDYGARLYDPYIGVWISPDPLSRKYPNISPYVFCNSNPVNFVDPDGKIVHPNGKAELEVIRNTLPIEAREYVQLDESGNINTELLSQYNGDNYNYRNLLKLSSSHYVIEVTFSKEFEYKKPNGEKECYTLSYQSNEDSGLKKDTNFQNVSGLTTGEGGNFGKTLFPDNDGLQNSPDEKIHVYIVQEMQGVGRAEALSHELYGHALLYVLNGGNHAGASHNPKKFFQKDYDLNFKLARMIKMARKNTVTNYSNP